GVGCLVCGRPESGRVSALTQVLGVARRAIPAVKLQRLGVAIVGVHQSADTARWKLCGWRRNRRKRADAISPLTKGKARTRNGVSRIGKAEHRCKDRRVAHLFHKQRDVLEYVAVVEAESPTQYVLSSASHVVSEADSRAEVLVVVMW